MNTFRRFGIFSTVFVLVLSLGAGPAFAAASFGIISGGSTKIANGTTFAIGNNSSDWYGIDVAGIGDIDSNGVPDIVGGALLDGTPGADYGAVYITRLNSSGGAVGTSKITHGTANGPTLASGYQYGSGVTGIGDLDGNGVPDIAVGAPLDGKGSVHIHRLTSAGAIVTSGTTRIADVTNGGPSLPASSQFGSSVGNAGDIDDNGVNDIIVGAPAENSGKGAFYVLFMNSGGTVNSSVRITDGVNGGPALAVNGNYGSGIAGLGDVDNDGTPDVAVGSYHDNANGANSGSVHVHFMNSDGTVRSASTVKITGATANGPVGGGGMLLGNGVSAGGDMDADGVPDLIAGSDALQRLYIILLNSNGSPKATTTISSATTNGPTLGTDGYGIGVAGIGDIDNNGVRDVAAGAFIDGASDYGAVHLHRMSRTNDAPTLTSISPTTKTAGDATFTLTVNGTNFITSATVRVDGVNRTTTFVSPTQMTASIPNTDVATAGTKSITVNVPTPGGGTTSAQTLTVNNPAPTLTSVSPNAKIVGDAQFSMTFTGTGFNASSVARINGSSRTITGFTSTTLTVTIPASDMTTTGVHDMSVFNPTPGGGTSANQTFTVGNPVPTTTSISPTSKTVGDATFTLTVNGTNFLSSSVISLDASDLITTYVSPTQLTASVAASLIDTADTLDVTVFNPTPGGGTSGAQTLTVNNPAPTTTSISPTTKSAGQATFTLTVNGTNFVDGSVVKVGGSNRTTTYVSPTQLTASIPDTDIATPGTLSITVFNGTPGGGTSGAQTLTVINPAAVSLSSISPNAKILNDASFVMTLTGTNFTASSVARFNGSSRFTTYVSSTQLTAVIPFMDLQAAGTANISVYDPDNGTSGNVTLTINQPVPAITTITPTAKLSGAPNFTLTVNGQNFSSGSVIELDGDSLTTTFVSSTQLTATVTSGDIASPGAYPVTVFNPSPGGGTSNEVTLAVSGNVSVSHSPQLPLTVDEVTVIGNVQYGTGLDRVEIYLDGTDPGDLVHTCELTAETSYVCSDNLGTLAYGSHTVTVVAVGNDTVESTGSETFHVSDYTTENEVELSRHKIDEESVVTARYFLPTALSGIVTVTFPAGFSVLTAPTDAASSDCLTDFGYAPASRMIYATKNSCSGNIVLGGATVMNPSSAGIYQVTWVNDDPGGGPVAITDNDEINVTATVDPYISFRVVATSDACDNGVDGFTDDTSPAGNGGTVALGTLSPLSATSSDANSVNHVCTFVSTNASAGYSLSARSTNGQLYSASASSGIPNAPQTGAAGTVTAQAGVNSYGMCLLSTAGVGKDVTLPVGYDLAATAPYDSTCTGTNATQSMGSLTTATNQIGAGPGEVQDGWARWLLKASITATQAAAADYEDTITFVATSTY